MVLDAGTAAQQATVLPSLPSRPGIAGAIVILPPEPSEQLVALRAREFPFVVVDPRTPVPRDIAAVSAAHFTGARSILTTIRQPLAEMGRMAVSLLIRLLDGHQVDALHIELATDLIMRDSVGPARPA